MSHQIDLQIACEETEIPSELQFQLWVDTALSEASNNTSPDFELTIRLVSRAESQQLNSLYRGKDKPTNVLSFPFEVPDNIELNLLGDLVICIEVMKQEAVEQNKVLFDHWAHLVIHGCLHLLGFDHISEDEAVEMESLEVNILRKLGISDPYIAQ